MKVWLACGRKVDSNLSVWTLLHGVGSSDGYLGQISRSLVAVEVTPDKPVCVDLKLVPTTPNPESEGGE